MRRGYEHGIWIVSIAAISLLLTYGLVDRLRVPRDWFVLGHVVVTGGMLAAYFRWSGVDWSELPGQWWLGALGGAVAGAIMIGFVLSGPRSPRPDGFAFVWALAWLGLIYALVDTFLLTVFPVHATRGLLGVTGRVGDADNAMQRVSCFGLSLVMTLIYHFGFPEFRGPAMISALIGNGVMTLSYLLTRSLVAPLFAHVALHVTAVSVGYLNALPAPPHYL